MIGGSGTGIELNDWPTRSPATIRGTSDMNDAGLSCAQLQPAAGEKRGQSRHDLSTYIQPSRLL